MTFSEYIKTISDTKIFKCSQSNLIVILFISARAVKDVEQETAKKWASGYRNCKIEKYFPHDKIDEKCFIECLQSRIGDNWKTIQAAFQGKVDCIVDCDTDVDKVFYRSLMNQFLTSLGLPLAELKSKQMVDIFQHAIEKYRISAFLNASPTNGVKADLVSNVKAFLVALKQEILCDYLYQKDDLTYKNISDFLDILKEYEMYFLKNTYLDHIEVAYFPDFSEKAFEEKLDGIYFSLKSDDFCYKIDAVHRKICSDISLLVPQRTDKDDEEYDFIENGRTVLKAYKQLSYI